MSIWPVIDIEAIFIVKCADDADKVPLVKSDRSANAGEETLGPLRIAFSDEGPVFVVGSPDKSADDSAVVVSMSSVMMLLHH